MQEKLTEQSSQTNPLGTARIGKLMLKFAVPSIISMVVNNLYNMVDQVFIGQGVGYLGNAATNIILPLTIALFAVSFLIGDGAAAYMSLRLGENRADKAARGVGGAIIMVLIAGLMLCVLCLAFLEPLCRLFGSTDAVLPYALDFGFVIALGFPLAALCAGLGGVIRADGRPATTMIGLLIGFTLNMALNPIFIFVCGWGVTGSALATIIGQGCNALFFIICLFRFKTISLNKQCFIPKLRIYGRILVLGLSSFITNIVSVLVVFVVNNAMVEYGALSSYGPDIPLAAYGVVMKVGNLMTGIALGLAIGVQPILGFNYGSKQYDRVKKTFKLAIFGSVAVLFIAWIIFQVFPLQITHLFERESEAYIEFSIKCFRICMLACVAIGPGMVCGIFFQSLGMPLQASILTLSRQALILVPSVIIFGEIFGLEGVLWASPLSDVLACILGLILVKAHWKKIFAENESPLHSKHKKESLKKD